MFIVIRTPTWQSHTERIWNSWCHWQSTILKKIVICKLQSDLDIWIIHSNIQFGKFWKRKLIPKFYWWLHLYLWCVSRFGKPATSLKVTFLHGCFSRFLNCTNGTKSNTSSQRHLTWHRESPWISQYCVSSVYLLHPWVRFFKVSWK